MITLREVKLSDANDLFKITSNKNVVKYLFWNEHENIDETKNVIKNFYLTKKDIVKINSQAIVYNKNNKVIGIIDLHKNGDIVEIGYFLAEEYWSMGIMTIALNKMLNIVFNKLNYSKIYISHNILNKGSEKVILKNNFKHFKNIKRFVKTKNEDVELKYYYLKRNDYNDKNS